MKKLIKGLHKFQTEVFPIHKNFFQDLTKGQNPETLFISCSDSRINPQWVTSAEPGDLFIIRNAGNIIPPYGPGMSGEAATIEFAVNELQVKHIIVCGHSHCGAVDAVFYIDSIKNQPHLQAWITSYVLPTLTFVKENYQGLDEQSLKNILLQEHVLQQITNLKTYPCVQQAIMKRKLSVHAWVYKFEDGDIFSFNQHDGQFERVKHL